MVDPPQPRFWWRVLAGAIGFGVLWVVDFLWGCCVMAGLCAFICPGLGHLILGKPFQALIWFLLIVVGYFMFIVPGIILHLISIIDAARAGRQDQISAMTTAIRNANK